MRDLQVLGRQDTATVRVFYSLSDHGADHFFLFSLFLFRTPMMMVITFHSSITK